ncbi:MAG TPA: hypothetical protein VHC90_26000 [Bryobacteraceae bacterium]|nr:hypothetical protein [Bryobacteraceae bacterium]
MRIQNARFDYLERVFVTDLMVGAPGEREASHSAVVIGVPCVAQTDGQGVIGGELPVDLEVRLQSGERRHHGLREWDNVQRGVQNLSVDDCIFIDIAAFEIQREGCLLVQWAADFSFPLLPAIRRLRSDEGIARVEGGIAELIEDIAMKIIGARFGEDFDTAVARSVELRGKRILIDANLPDRLFRGQPATRESVDEYLAAAGTCRRAGERLEIWTDRNPQIPVK